LLVWFGGVGLRERELCGEDAQREDGDGDAYAANNAHKRKPRAIHEPGCHDRGLRCVNERSASLVACQAARALARSNAKKDGYEDMSGRLISGARELPLAALQERAERAASAFASIGVGPGDGVALFLRNDFAFFEAGMAAGLLGAYSVPVNWHFTVEEAAHIITDSGAKAVVVHTDLLPVALAATPAGVPVLAVDTPPEIAAAYQLSPEACAMRPGVKVWDAWIESFPRRAPAASQAPGAIIYTSGTTGRPKGVRRFPPTEAQTLALTKLIARAFGFDQVLVAQKPERIITVVTGPMYHSAPNAYGGYAVRTGAR
jgi:long-chain acyl-CoA synthetase